MVAFGQTFLPAAVGATGGSFGRSRGLLGGTTKRAVAWRSALAEFPTGRPGGRADRLGRRNLRFTVARYRGFIASLLHRGLTLWAPGAVLANAVAVFLRSYKQNAPWR